MGPMSLRLSPLDVYTADDESMYALADLQIRYKRLIFPEDPALSLKATVRHYRNPPDFFRVKAWAIWDLRRMAAFASAGYNIEDQSDRTMNYRILVDPEYRRLGLARNLLAQIYGHACQTQRELLMTETIDRDLDGVRFLERVGAKRGLEMEMNQLDLQALDREMLKIWQDRAVERAGNFTLVFCENAYPEEDIGQIAELYNEVINTAPNDDLDIPESHMTVENLNQMLAMEINRGNLYWAVYARENDSKVVAGYTEVSWNPEQVTILNQYASVVRTSYRNRGLGHWLKAAMLEHVLSGLPQVRYVRTGNANSNAAMLKINHELGFTHYMAQTLWQIDLLNLQAYLERQHVRLEYGN